MDDLINRKGIVDTVCEGISCNECSFNEIDGESGCLLAYRIDNLPSAQETGKWIPVSERLPDEDKNVLVTVHFHGLTKKHSLGWNKQFKPSYYVEVANQIDGEWCSYSDEYKVAKDRHEVIAWMPLPSPYKGE